jgi:hypothetical protein
MKNFPPFGAADDPLGEVPWQNAQPALQRCDMYKRRGCMSTVSVSNCAKAFFHDLAALGVPIRARNER